MATEPAAETELSVPLSPPLSEWLDDRAAALGVEREELLVQLLGAYRATAETDPDDLTELISAELDATRTEPAVDPAEIDDIETRLETVDTALSDHVEDLRSRILQLRDAVEESAPEDHGHAEIETLGDEVERLSNDIETVRADVDELSSAIESTEGDLRSVESKLDRLARVVLGLKRRADRETETEERLERLRRLANERGLTEADCGDCGERLRIGLLSEAACPACGHDFDGVEPSESLLGRFKTPKLVGAAPGDGKADGEADGASEDVDDE